MKRLLLALLFGVLAYTIALASAATISTVTDSGLGAGNAAVVSCDDAVNTAYTTTYQSTAPGPGYVVTAVKVTNILSACDGKNVSVTVANTGGGSPTSSTAPVAVASNAATVPVPGILASNAGAVYVQIGG